MADFFSGILAGFLGGKFVPDGLNFYNSDRIFVFSFLHDLFRSFSWQISCREDLTASIFWTDFVFCQENSNVLAGFLPPEIQLGHRYIIQLYTLFTLVGHSHGMERNNLSVVKKYLNSSSRAELKNLIGNENFFKSPKKVRRRLVSETRNIVDYTKTKWGLTLQCPTMSDPTSSKAKLFRRRFRMPFNLFLYIFKRCEEESIFSATTNYQNKIPDSIKLMCCLRILGRDNYFDDMSEMA